MALAETVVNRVSYNFFWPEPLDPDADHKALLSPSRWKKYRDLFNTLDLDAGISMERGKSVNFWYRTSGLLSVSATYKGFLWSRDEPTPYAAETEAGAVCGNGDCRAFRSIDENWFIYFHST